MPRSFRWPPLAGAAALALSLALPAHAVDLVAIGKLSGAAYDHSGLKAVSDATTDLPFTLTPTLLATTLLEGLAIVGRR